MKPGFSLNKLFFFEAVILIITFFTFLFIHFHDAPWAETLLEYRLGVQNSGVIHTLLNGWAGYLGLYPTMAIFLSSLFNNGPDIFLIAQGINAIWFTYIAFTSALVLRKHANLQYSKTKKFLMTLLPALVILVLTLHPSAYSITSASYFGVLPAFVLIGKLCIDRNRLQQYTRVEQAAIAFPLIVASLSKPSLLILALGLLIFFRVNRLKGITVVSISVIQLVLSSSKSSADLNFEYWKSHLLLDLTRLTLNTLQFLCNPLLLVISILLIAFALSQSLKSNLKAWALFAPIIYTFTCFLLALVPWMAYNGAAIYLSGTLLKIQYITLPLALLLLGLVILVTDRALEPPGPWKILSLFSFVLILISTAITQFSSPVTVSERGLSSPIAGMNCTLGSPLPGWDLQIGSGEIKSLWTDCKKLVDFDRVIVTSSGTLQINHFAIANAEEANATLIVFYSKPNSEHTCSIDKEFVDVNEDIYFGQDGFGYLLMKGDYRDFSIQQVKCLSAVKTSISVGHVLLYDH